MSIGGRMEGLVRTDPGALTPISMSGINDSFGEQDHRQKNCETHYRGEGLQFSSWFLTNISHVSKTSLKSLLQVAKKLLTTIV